MHSCRQERSLALAFLTFLSSPSKIKGHHFLCQSAILDKNETLRTTVPLNLATFHEQAIDEAARSLKLDIPGLS